MAPLDVSEEELIKRLRKRARWIKRQLVFFEQFQPRTPERQYVGGETHLYLGRQYRLKLEAADRSSVKLKGGYFHIACKGGDMGLAERLLWGWYRGRADVVFRERLGDCMRGFKGHEVPRLVIKRLEKRWGSLAPSGVLTLNLDLIRASVDCIDYVVVHELCHLERPYHDRAFIRLLSSKLGDWRVRKRKLELRLS
ncbi:MAG: M48 family metallopeptidase [Ectothiorhodospiraceae bacterium AqS1]|nr:M48 family metallopeptidase [Ectothiorhodospiraceae bacterium AqS1]